MAKFLLNITTIQVNLVPNPSEEGNTNSLELSLLKILPLAYWPPPWIFHNGLFGATHFFTAGLFWNFTGKSTKWLTKNNTNMLSHSQDKPLMSRS